jgi:predicted ester cyclase
MAQEDSNKAAVRRLFEQGINEGDSAVIDELLADGYVNHDMPAPAPGPEGLKQVVGQFRAAFPDMRVVVDGVLGEGDAVCTRGHLEGTHEGEFMGVPATGRRITVKYIDIWRMEGGKAVENWVQMDLLGLMQQLGAIPSAG